MRKLSGTHVILSPPRRTKNPYISGFEKLFSRKYILASKSARRISLLKQIGLNFKFIDSKAEENESRYHNPIAIVKHNSELKAKTVSPKFKDEIIIGADTIVFIDNKILHKPADEKEAEKFLKMLSGKRHCVYTGIYVIDTKSGSEFFDYEKTDVHFRKLTTVEIRYYIKHYSPLDKAGAYGIQEDFGCLFIKKITGDYYNVVGLPLVRLYEMLLKVL